MNAHRRTLNKFFGKGLNLDWNNLIKSKIVQFDTKVDALVYENCLRNEPYIGWNKERGGGNETAKTGNTYNLGHKHKHTDEARAKMSAAKMGNTGAKNSNYKGAMIGTNICTGEVIIFEGNAAVEAAGFHQSNISSVINGRDKTYKGFTWIREVL
jgi:hypothetical protein